MGLSPESIITAICPALAGSPSLQVYLGMAVETTSRGFFGQVYNQAVAYMAAHLFTALDGGNSMAKHVSDIGGGAPVSGMSEGGVSVSFAQSGDASDLGSTKYGRMLRSLMRSRPTMGVNQAGGGLL